MTHQIKARPHLENRANNIRRQIMNNLEALIKHYLEYCNTQKRLDSKTLKAYNIDLRQFSKFVGDCAIENISSEMLESYIGDLHNSYKPKTVKRKIASLKSFFHHLEYKEMINRNPFNRIQIRFREPVILPKTIPLHTVEKFLTTIYRQRDIEIGRAHV